MHTRTFRLFVSSTFSDFTEERKLLQTVVFPRIKDYCKEKKLVFQPIDLRWGVTDEASNDQKTLELCLDEVQTSKLHPYPNFLIMMGDRYGTVILPYLIEKNEFETILNHIESEDDKNLLTTWYRLDENQIPASYIIEQRKDAKESIDGIDYTNRANWKPINNRLLNILQNTVSNIDIKKNDKKKYFASATEAEIIEGIFKYLEKTKFQQKLLGNDTQVESYDYEHVYAYIRNIKHIDNVDLKNQLQDDDSTSVAFVKEELKRSLAQKNIYSVECNLTNITQDENGKLNYYYKELNDGKINFVSKMTEYLKRSIDKFLEEIESAIDGKNDEQIKIFSKKIEQKRFKDTRVNDFLEGSRTIALQKIDDYINGNNNQPLVIYGRSGLGKSSLLAKAIDNTLKIKDEECVVYRFVGATSSLSDSPSLLISILRELGIDEAIKKVINPQTGKEENEKIEDFYFRVHDYFANSNQEEKIIFIDAVDQLTNEDEFLWLPNELPLNLKIIISALEDGSYPDDSKYFESLKTKTDNLYPLEPFEDSKKLIENILARYDRTMTENQMNYLLSQEDSNSPLYLTVAAQEIRHWESYASRELAPTQKEIINEYITNLNKLFHHDKELVKRVFCYIYLTDGLSESEILEILNTDKNFISQIAPDTHHKKETEELPIVIWARFHFQIKEFLKLEEQDGYETMKFFHREFINAIVQQEEIHDINKKLIFIIQKLIEKYQYDDFESNRWGKLYVETIANYHVKYETVMYPNDLEIYSSIKQYSEVISHLSSYNYKKKVYSYCKNRGKKLQLSMHVPPHYIINYFFLSILKEDFEGEYADSLELLSQCFYQQLIGVNLAGTALNIREKHYNKDESVIFEYIDSLMNYAKISFVPNVSLKTYEKALSIIGNLYYKSCLCKPANMEKISTTYIECSLTALSDSLQFYDNKQVFNKVFDDEFIDSFIDGIIEELKTLFPVIKYTIINNKYYYFTRYYNIFSKATKRQGDINTALEYCQKAFEYIQKLYEKNESEYRDLYALTLNDLGILYNKIGNHSEAVKCQEENVRIRKKQYEKYPIYWATVYFKALVNLFSSLDKYSDTENAIKNARLAKSIADRHGMEVVPGYKYIAERLETFDKFSRTIINNESILTLRNELGHQKFISIILTLGKEDIYSDYIEKHFLSIVNDLKYGQLEKSKNNAGDFLNFLYPELLEKQQYNQYYEYAMELLNYLGNVQKYKKHRSILNDMLSRNEKSDLMKMPIPNIQIFKLIYNSYNRNKDLWWSTYIAYCIDLSSFFGILSYKESAIFAKEALHEIQITQNSRINTPADEFILNQFLTYIEYMHKIIDNSLYFKHSLLDLEIIQSDHHMSSFLKKYDTVASKKLLKGSLTTLLLIAKGLSIKYNNSDDMRPVELYNALHSVELAPHAEEIFRQIFSDDNIDNLNKNTDGFELIELAKNHPKIKYDESMKNLVKRLKEIFGDDEILNVRELYIPEYDINDDEIPF